MENASEGTRMCLPHTEHVQVKRNIILNYRKCQNISGENLRLLKSKMLSIFGSTWATFVNFSVMSRVEFTLPRVLQTVNYNHNFIVLLLLFPAEFLKIQDFYSSHT